MGAILVKALHVLKSSHKEPNKAGFSIFLQLGVFTYIYYIGICVIVYISNINVHANIIFLAGICITFLKQKLFISNISLCFHYKRKKKTRYNTVFICAINFDVFFSSVSLLMSLFFFYIFATYRDGFNKTNYGFE